MEDFFYAGGMRAFMTRLAPQLALDAMTVSGTTLGETIAGATVWNDEVIRPYDHPLYPEAAPRSCAATSPRTAP